MIRESKIGARVAQMHAAAAAGPSDEAAAPFRREQAMLAVRGLPPGVAAVGTLVPDAELLDPDGGVTTLYAATGNGTAVVVFYRGAWCPYCNIALAAYQAHLLPQLTERGVELIAISPQRPDGSLTMQQKHELAFTVLSDPGNVVAGRLGILTQPSEEARAAQLELGLDLTTVNADSTVTLPMPTTIILTGDHLVRWIDVHPDYSSRTEPWQILQSLDEAGL
jgi:peroxiredoxin